MRPIPHALYCAVVAATTRKAHKLFRCHTSISCWTRPVSANVVRQASASVDAPTSSGQSHALIAWLEENGGCTASGVSIQESDGAGFGLYCRQVRPPLSSLACRAFGCAFQLATSPLIAVYVHQQG